MFRLLFRLGYSLFLVNLVVRAGTVLAERLRPTFLGFHQISVGLANDIFLSGAFALILALIALIPKIRQTSAGRLGLRLLALVSWFVMTGLAVWNLHVVIFRGSNLSIQDLSTLVMTPASQLFDALLPDLRSWGSVFLALWIIAAWFGSRHMLGVLTLMQRRIAGGASLRLAVVFVLGLFVTIGARSYMLSNRQIFHAPVETHPVVYLIWRFEEERHFELRYPEAGALSLASQFTRAGLRPLHERARPLRNFREKLARAPMQGIHALPDKTNVIFIEIESLSPSAEVSTPDTTPRLRELRANSLDLKRHYANSWRGDSVHWALLCGSQNPEVFSIIGEFPRTHMRCLPAMLAEKGYSTLWLMGAPRSRGNLALWLKTNHFQQVLGQEDFPRDVERTVSGIHDGPVYERLLSELDSTQEPFFALMTTSSGHPPLSVPSQFYDSHPESREWEMEQQTSYYADTMLGEFLDKMRTRPWSAHTLVVLVGTHPVTAHRPVPMTSVQNLSAARERYHTIALFNHTALAPVPVTTVTGHADIPATIADLLGVSGENDFASTGLFHLISGSRWAAAVDTTPGKTLMVFRERKVTMRALNDDDNCVTSDEAAPDVTRPCTPEERENADDIRASHLKTTQWQILRSQRTSENLEKTKEP